MKATPGFDKTGSNPHPEVVQRPRISTNVAISADGKISSTRMRPSGWTSQEDKRRFSLLRENADAILVGRGTLDHDRMTMLSPKNPLRCIVSRSGKLDPTHPIFSAKGGDIHLLVTGDIQPDPIPGVTIHHMNLAEFLNFLASSLAVKTLHCEGGGELIHELAELDVIDDFYLTMAAHTIFGGVAAPTATGIGTTFLPHARHYHVVSFDQRPDLGECYLTYSRSRNDDT